MQIATVYHATNLAACVSIQKTGFGLDKEAYQKVLSDIRAYCPMSDRMYDAIFHQVFQYEPSEVRGGTSFFPSLEACLQIAPYYNRGGEYLKIFIDQCLKSWCRRTKHKFQEYKQVHDFVLGDITPVVLKVQVPVVCLANWSTATAEHELYTTRRLDIKEFHIIGLFGATGTGLDF